MPQVNKLKPLKFYCKIYLSYKLFNDELNLNLSSEKNTFQNSVTNKMVNTRNFSFLVMNLYIWLCNEK